MRTVNKADMARPMDLMARALVRGETTRQETRDRPHTQIVRLAHRMEGQAAMADLSMAMTSTTRATVVEAMATRRISSTNTSRINRAVSVRGRTRRRRFLRTAPPRLLPEVCGAALGTRRLHLPHLTTRVGDPRATTDRQFSLVTISAFLSLSPTGTAVSLAA
jgi:hypothetical protein